MKDIKISLRPSATRSDKYTATWHAELRRWELDTDYYKIKVWPEDGEIQSFVHVRDRAYSDKADRVRAALEEKAKEQFAAAA